MQVAEEEKPVRALVRFEEALQVEDGRHGLLGWILHAGRGIGAGGGGGSGGERKGVRGELAPERIY